MSAPKKHHFVPAFYLRRWAGEDGCVCQFSRPDGITVKPIRRAPGATGFQTRLYSIDGLPDDEAHVVESGFMQTADSLAATSLAKIDDGDPTEWDSKARDAWTRFVLSLLFRDPASVAQFKAAMREIWAGGLTMLERNYANIRRPGDPATFEDYLVECDPLTAEKSALRLIVRMIDNSRVGPSINAMRWHRVTYPKSRRTLLTSDRPVEMPRGLGNRHAHIAMPIGPRTIFIAAYTDWAAKQLRHADPDKVIADMNLGTVARARSYVWGLDDRQLRFVQNNMGKGLERGAITEDHKRSALAATARSLRAVSGAAR